ncbi:avidin isoform X1 [Pygocentrus nattereri]|uniref:Avidin n=1 Tax=Pygocentrus nattereri TaxID=42514 RepID=A0A3B4CWM3_PYGNA|nr:avidin isoform X1 [Pygocentrus nattereri]
MKSLVFCGCFCVFVLGAAQLFAEQEPKQVTRCNVTGQWRSEQGSMLQLTSTGPEVRGIYHTAVETALGASGHNRESKVVGVVGHGLQPAVAFSVLWAKGSCSSWVGQCFLLPGGGQVLKTLWMLRSVVESSLDNWESTRLGEDQFIFVGHMEGRDGH